MMRIHCLELCDHLTRLSELLEAEALRAIALRQDGAHEARAEARFIGELAHAIRESDSWLVPEQ